MYNKSVLARVRARKVNNVQPKSKSKIKQLPYPLRLKNQGPFKYFQAREEWKVTDILMNPTVIMMVLPPLLLITVLQSINKVRIEADATTDECQLPMNELLTT